MRNFQILKKTRIYEVEVMRTVQLFSVAFDMNNSAIGMEVMKRVEKVTLIFDQQSDSKKHINSVFTTLKKS